MHITPLRVLHLYIYILYKSFIYIYVQYFKRYNFILVLKSQLKVLSLGLYEPAGSFVLKYLEKLFSFSLLDSKSNQLSKNVTC